MFAYEFEAIARATLQDHLVEADQRRLAREIKERNEQSATRTEERQSRRPARLWRLVHRPHAYG